MSFPPQYFFGISSKIVAKIERQEGEVSEILYTCSNTASLVVRWRHKSKLSTLLLRSLDMSRTPVLLCPTCFSIEPEKQPWSSWSGYMVLLIKPVHASLREGGKT
jgi:hypothetical protein